MNAPRASVTRFATRQNARVAYDPGTPAAGDSPPIVLLHDLLADRTDWNPVRAVLADHHRVIVPDARGHGASPTLSNQWYTVAELAADLLAVLDTEQLATVHIAGHGLGAATAFDFAHRHPTRVSSLTLIAPALFSILDNHPDPAVRTTRVDLRTTDRTAADAAYKGLIEKALDTYLIPRKGVNWRQTLTKPQLGAVRRHAPALSALLPALDAYIVDCQATRTLDVKTCLVCNLDDIAIHRLTSQSLADLLPRSQTIYLGRREVHEFAQPISGFIESCRA